MKTAVFAALALLLVTSTPASAAPFPITYKLKATALGQSAEFTLDQPLDATAPETVAPGGVITAVIDPGPNTIPSEASGYTVREIKTLVLSLPVPANSTFQSATATGGSGLGNGKPTITLSGNNVVLRIAGPIKGGAAFELPTITLNLVAGQSGSVSTQLGGSSYTAPGLTFTAGITAFGFPIDAPSTGYPDPNPILTTTAIG